MLKKLSHFLIPLLFLVIADPIFAQSSQLSVTQQLWQSNQASYAAILQTPFIEEMLAGTLKQKNMHNFILQDIHYLDAYQKAMQLISQRYPKYHPLRDVFAAHSLAAKHEKASLEKQWLKVSNADHAYRELPVTAAYKQHLLNSAQQGTLGEAIAAIIPCTEYFSKLGVQLSQRVNMSAHPFAAWIKQYSSPGDTSAQQLLAIADQLAIENPAEIKNMQSAYAKSAQFELAFFQQAAR